jgi:hypothetical protein
MKPRRTPKPFRNRHFRSGNQTRDLGAAVSPLPQGRVVAFYGEKFWD